MDKDTGSYKVNGVPYIIDDDGEISIRPSDINDAMKDAYDQGWQACEAKVIERLKRVVGYRSFIEGIIHDGDG